MGEITESSFGEKRRKINKKEEKMKDKERQSKWEKERREERERQRGREKECVCVLLNMVLNIVKLWSDGSTTRPNLHIKMVGKDANSEA